MTKDKINLWIIGSEFDLSESWIFSGLAKRGFRVTAFHSQNMLKERRQILINAGVECIELNVRSRLDFCASTFLHRELKHRPCDLIYAPLNRPLAAALRAVRGHRNVRVVGYRGTMGHISWIDPSAWITYLHPRLDHIVGVSDAVRNYLVGKLGLPENKVTRIYKGHDVCWYRGKQIESPVPDAEPGCVSFCFAGQMRPVKGVDYLLDAMALVPRDMNIRLMLMGGIKDAGIARRISEINDSRVKYIGFRRDATAVIGLCDVFVMPTVEREGLARAVIEAMSHGLPSIVSNVGGLPELVEDGNSGIVVPPRNSRAIADAMMKLAENQDLRSRMGSAAYERVKTRFNYKQSIDEFEKLFESLVQR